MPRRHCFVFKLPPRCLRGIPEVMAASFGKRRRLADLVALGKTTDSALATLLEELARRPFVGTTSRREVSKAACLEYDDDIGCTITLLLDDGKQFEWHLCRPDALLHRLAEASPALRRMFEVAPSSPSAPWDIVLAHDEVTPGSVLKPMNERKFIAFYITFRQFGPYVRMDSCWFPLAVLRSKIMQKVTRNGTTPTLLDPPSSV